MEIDNQDIDHQKDMNRDEMIDSGFPEEKTFFKEVIEKPPRRFGKKTLALVLLFGLIAGTCLGMGAKKLVTDELTGSKMAYATENISTGITTVSPVVPIAKKVSPSIVAIEMKSSATDFFGRRFESKGTGSGIIIDSDGYIVTNNHVVEGAEDLTVVLSNGTRLSATLIGTDPTSDLAIIKVNKTGLSVAEMGDSSKVQVGELAVAIGSPMGTDFAGSVTAGIISGINRQVSVGDRTMTLIQTDAAINPGNSGGALVNANGQVIGINTLKLAESEVEGMGFSIPINEAKPIIQELIKNKKIVRPYIGIGGLTISKEDAQTYDLPQGVYVHDVVPNSGADKAGIVKGDVITKIDGQSIQKIEELVNLVSKHKVGDKLTVEIVDKFDRTRTVTVTLQASPTSNS